LVLFWEIDWGSEEFYVLLDVFKVGLTVELEMLLFVWELLLIEFILLVVLFMIVIFFVIFGVEAAIEEDLFNTFEVVELMVILLPINVVV
jgi:hypothetical protein